MLGELQGVEPLTETLIVDAALRYGPLGLILVAAATGFVVFKPHVTDLKEQITLLRSDLHEARTDHRRVQDVLGTIVPAITQTQTAVQKLTDELLWRRRETP